MEKIQENKKSLIRWTPKVFQEAVQIFREKGLKAVIKRFGWKFFAFFFMYYLIRDLTLYVFIPWYIANKIMQN